MENTLKVNLVGHPDEVFNPNQTLSIVVILDVKKTIKKTKGLQLKIIGSADVKWTVGIRSNSVNYEGRQEFFNVEHFFLGSVDGKVIEVAAGCYTYEYNYNLPANIPSSVRCQKGNIQYKVEVNVVIPWSLNLRAEKLFQVVRFEDLNLFPKLRSPYEVEEAKTFCCCCCKSGSMILKVWIPRTGYAMGENITITIELNNKSSRKVVYTSVELENVVIYTSTSPQEDTTDSKQKLASGKFQGIGGGELVKFDATLQIPNDIMLSNIGYCRVLQIIYIVKVTAITSGLSVPPFVEFPITIGSVGLNNNGYQTVEPFNQTSLT